MLPISFAFAVLHNPPQSIVLIMCVCLISWYFIAEIIFRDFLHFIVSKCIYHILIYLLYIYIYIGFLCDRRVAFNRVF